MSEKDEKKLVKRSFSERTSIVYPPVVVDKRVIGYPKVVEKVENGKVVKQVEFVVETEEDRSQYQVNDFALENLLVAGVNLKEMSFNTMSLSSVDAFVAAMPEKVTPIVESKN